MFREHIMGMSYMYELTGAVKWKWWMFKTKYFYRFLFGSIGDRSTICKPMRIVHPERIYLGKRVRIREFARLEAIVEYNAQRLSPKLEIGDGAGFEQGLHMTCGNSIKIGGNVTVSAYAMITDCTHCYQDLYTNVLNQELVTDPVEIGEGCFIGIGARIMPGTHMGKHCTVGANSVVMGSFPDYCVLAGVPARCIKRYDKKNKQWRRTDGKGNFLTKNKTALYMRMEETEKFDFG